MAKKEMTYLYELAEFLLVSDLQPSAYSIDWWRVDDKDVGKDKLDEKKNKPKKMTLPRSHKVQQSENTWVVEQWNWFITMLHIQINELS